MERSDQQVELTPGVTLEGRYRIDGLLGQGGMGRVWNATQLSLGRPVVVKTLRAEVSRSDVVVRRFLREARSAAELDHEGVVRILDVGRLSDASPYFVMEKLEGQTVDDALAGRGSFSVEDTCEWLAPVAGALDAAHAGGIIHRDVKPANMFRATTAAGTTTKLLDFGVAALRDDSGADRATKLTLQGTLVGTPHYMAPECAEGEAGGPRSDIYALACVAYKMLTGRVPYHADTTMGVLTAKIHQSAPSLSERGGTAFAASVEALFVRALSRDPAERPSTASAFVARLREAARDSKAAIVTIPPARREPSADDLPFAEGAEPRPRGDSPRAASAQRSDVAWFAAASLAVMALMWAGCLWL